MATMPPEQLEQLLVQALTPDSVREAEAALKRALGTPGFMLDLADRLRRSQRSAVYGCVHISGP